MVRRNVLIFCVYFQEIERLTRGNSSSSSYHFSTFSTATLNKILEEHSRINIFKLGIVFAALAVYGWVAHSCLATLGVLVLASSAAAALGVCSLIGLPMNLLSMHVLPFLSVGLAMREMFLMLSTHNRNLSSPEVLQCTGPTVLSAAMINSAVLLVAAVIPVPALRVFCLQCAILVAFHAAALLVIFPALISLQQRFRKAAVPCFKSEAKPVPQNNNNDPVSW